MPQSKSISIDKKSPEPKQTHYPTDMSMLGSSLWNGPDITLTSQWLRWRLKSPASRLFTQSFIQTQIKENIKAPRHRPLFGGFTGTCEFPAQRLSNAENGSIWWRHHVKRPWPSSSMWVPVSFQWWAFMYVLWPWVAYDQLLKSGLADSVTPSGQTSRQLCLTVL